MKKFIISLALAFAAMSSANAQDWKPKVREQIEQANDSILEEGIKLYDYEKAAWLGTDLVIEHCKYKDELTGVIVYEATDGKLHCIAYDKYFLQCLFDYTFDESNSYSDAKRPLTQDEAKLIGMKTKMQEKCIETQTIQDCGPLNTDLIPLPNGNYRFYWLTGTTETNIVPIGNDYSFDFDENLNIIKQTKYHKSLLSMEIKEGVTSIIHSHLDDNPYMTPTDVCNYLLYARDCYNIQSFLVLSPALDGIHFMDDKANSIASITTAVLKKINKHQAKKNKQK